jgi:RNA recognition motif-containing protein
MCLTQTTQSAEYAAEGTSPALRVADFVTPDAGCPAYVQFLSDDQKNNVFSNCTRSNLDGCDSSTSGRAFPESGDEASVGIRVDADDAAAHGLDSHSIATLMIKNIPCRCSKEEVLGAIRELGFAKQYDFFYLPMRRSQQQNFGYAFISLSDSAVVHLFRERFEGYVFKRRKSRKLVTVVPAHIQGYKSNLEFFSKTNIMESNHAPIFARVQNDSDDGVEDPVHDYQSLDIRAFKQDAAINAVVSSRPQAR